MNVFIAAMLVLIALSIPQCRDLIIAAVAFSLWLAIWATIIGVSLYAAAWVLIP